jgi:transcriptional regulatory protein LevR
LRAYHIYMSYNFDLKANCVILQKLNIRIPDKRHGYVTSLLKANIESSSSN